MPHHAPFKFSCFENMGKEKMEEEVEEGEAILFPLILPLTPVQIARIQRKHMILSVEKLGYYSL